MPSCRVKIFAVERAVGSAYDFRVDMRERVVEKNGCSRFLLRNWRRAGASSQAGIGHLEDDALFR